MELHRKPDDLEDLGLMTDEVRRRLYELTAGGSSVTRDEAAAAVGVSRSLAAYHLDRLADAGMLDVGYARVNGRSGPGAGRPAKQYLRSTRELSVSFPQRSYSLLAHVMVAAAEASASGEFRAALSEAAEHEGMALGAQSESITDALCTAGFEPATAEDGDIVLRNCPFHSVARHHTELVCGLNHSFVRGTLQGTRADPARAELCPAEGRCCVVVHATPEEA